MKSTWFSKKEHHEFGKLLRDADNSHGLWDNFNTFIECGFCSLSQAVRKLQTGSVSEDVEKQYMREVSRVKHADKLAEALSVMVLALEKYGAYDFLGTVASELELLNSNMGQFFTPAPVADLLASMNFAGIKPDPRNRLRLCEPACGGGATILPAARQLHNAGFTASDYWVDAIDLDPRMYKICYMQMTLCGVAGRVYNDNTLSMEMHDSMPTLTGVLHPWKDKPRPRKRVLPRG